MDSPLQWRHWFLSFQNKNNQNSGGPPMRRATSVIKESVSRSWTIHQEGQ